MTIEFFSKLRNIQNDTEVKELGFEFLNAVDDRVCCWVDRARHLLLITYDKGNGWCEYGSVHIY